MIAAEEPVSEEGIATKLLEQVVGDRFTDGNSIEILQNGNEIFPAMLEAIDGATERVDFATYVYWTGDIARQFAAALSEKARRGVRVRVLLDAFGSKKMDSSLADTMRAAGVEVRWFRPLATWQIWRTDKRMHRKVLVCDDNVGFTGGVGIAKEWEGDARNPDEWRDTHIALRGPAITDLRAAFLDNWNEAGDWHFETKVAAPAEQASNTPVQVIRGSSTIGWTDTAAMLRALIGLSTRRIRIVTAYFNPDRKLVELIESASERGVDVQVLVPGKYCDSRLSQLAGHKYVERLLGAGVRVWEYNKTMLHAKVMTVDSHVAFVGSANLNHRSMGKDEECGVIAISPNTVADLNRRFDSDCSHATLYDLQQWKTRSTWIRVQEYCARLVVTEL